ncbi:hypothetical protein HPP92_007440 [Vanilla planifolia]|uniref:Rho-GAP domain-containing protein n=1 Tax=Vanilla planifolia TaxID=51239 RepID=A0A835RCN0_VANPL|nr:hypothetical protein HPP92_007440 [Vanilla planifolia]
MPTEVSPHWREKASGFFSSSGVKLRQAGQSAGMLAKDAGENVVDAADRVGALFRNRWAVIQQARQCRPRGPPGETFQERFISAAAATGTLLRKGMKETKEKVVAGRMKVEEAAKKTAGKSKVILSNIECWQKGIARNELLIAPIEVIVQRQHSSSPVPEALVKCADNLIVSGLHTEHLFKLEGDKKVVCHLISLFNKDWNAPLPDGVNPIDVAALMKCYLASLPEPLTTFSLYHDIRVARSNINDMRNVLKKLPNVCYMTLEFVTTFLLRVSQKASLNKMDASSLAVEFAPIIMWQQGDSPVDFCGYLHYISKGPRTTDAGATFAGHDYLSDEDDYGNVASRIPLDDDNPQPDYGAIEVIRCLIEHHNAIFTDANDTIWR